MTLRLSRELAEASGKPLWFTEICCLDSRTGVWGPQYDPTIKAALQMANMIAQGLTVANDAAFHWWVACSSVIGRDPAADPAAVLEPNDDGWNDGLLYYDPNYAENGNQQIYVTKRYFALGHFSRYVRPGDRRHDVTGAPRDLQILAFANEPTGAPSTAPVQLPRAGTSAQRAWTFVVINNARSGSDPAAFRLQLPVSRAGAPHAPYRRRDERRPGPRPRRAAGRQPARHRLGAGTRPEHHDLRDPPPRRALTGRRLRASSAIVAWAPPLPS